MSSATVALVSALLKDQYTQREVYWEAYKNNPELATVAKDEKFVGNVKQVAIQIETPQGGGVTVALAQSHLLPGSYKRFTLTRAQDFSFVRVDDQAMRAADTEDGSLVKLWTREMDGGILTIKRQWAVMFWRSGTGSRGQMNGNVASNAITLLAPTDITGFAVGMTLQASNGDGGALRSAGANAIVQKIDRMQGILYFSDIFTNLIAAATNTDFLLREGDNNAVIHGMAAWIPQTAPNATAFNGLDRTPDVVRLAGQGLNAVGMTLREMTIEAMARIDVEGGEADCAWYHPRDRATLTKEFEGKSIYFKQVETLAKIPGSDAVMGFDAFRAEFDGQMLTVMSSLNVPRQHVYVGQWDTAQLATLGPFPFIQNADGNEFLRVYNTNDYEVRIAGYGDLEIDAPGYWVHAYNVGT